MNYAEAIARFAYRVLAVLGVLLLGILFTPALATYSESQAHPWPEATRGTLLVLGGPSAAPNRMADSSYWRSVYAVRAWRKGHFDKVFVTDTPASVQMVTFLRAHKVPASLLDAPDAERDLAAALAAVKAQASRLPQPLVLLTGDFHLPRTRSLVQRFELNATVVPFPDGIKRGQRPNWHTHLTLFSDLVHERLASWL